MDYWEIPDVIAAAARVMANTTISTLATPHFANVSAYFINGTNETAHPPDYGMWFTNALQIYPDLVGPIAYLLIFLIPYAMIWISNGDLRLITVLGIITGLFVFLYIGGTWAAFGVLAMLIAVIGTAWRLYRS